MKILRRSIEEVNQHSETITGYCRHLIKDGYDPDWALEVYRKGRINDPDVIVRCIGDAAQYIVDESRTPKLRKMNEKQLKFMGFDVDARPADAFK